MPSRNRLLNILSKPFHLELQSSGRGISAAGTSIPPISFVDDLALVVVKVQTVGILLCEPSDDHAIVVPNVLLRTVSFNWQEVPASASPSVSLVRLSLHLPRPPSLRPPPPTVYRLASVTINCGWSLNQCTFARVCNL